MNRRASFDPYRPIVGATRYEAEFERLHALHGDDDATRAQASAHESGHTILAASFGWRVTDTRILSDGSGKWYGVTNFQHELANQVLQVHKHPELVLASVIVTFGGMAAEQRVGLYHPCGSIGELLYASDACGQLDAWAGVESGTTLIVAQEAAAARLQAHAPSFDLLRTHLARTRRLLPTERSRMLRAVSPSPVKLPHLPKEKPAC